MTADLLRRVQDADEMGFEISHAEAVSVGLTWPNADPLGSVLWTPTFGTAQRFAAEDFPDASFELVIGTSGCSARITWGDIDVTDARLDQHLPLAITAAWLKAREAVAETTKDTRNV